MKRIVKGEKEARAYGQGVPKGGWRVGGGPGAERKGGRLQDCKRESMRVFTDRGRRLPSSLSSARGGCHWRVGGTCSSLRRGADGPYTASAARQGSARGRCRCPACRAPRPKAPISAQPPPKAHGSARVNQRASHIPHHAAGSQDDSVAGRKRAGRNGS